VAEAIRVLKEHGYNGWIVFEHEKRWHPELPEPEEILPQFVEWVKPLIA
jgi:sugar phosphate isomerase/epimerase